MQNEAKLPKSYLPAEEREALVREGGMNLVYVVECQEARRAGDEETAWKWMKFVEVPAYALMALKNRHGADFIRKKGLRTETAEAVYGKNWLEAH
jgi:hypothetical protein